MGGNCFFKWNGLIRPEWKQKGAECEEGVRGFLGLLVKPKIWSRKRKRRNLNPNWQSNEREREREAPPPAPSHNPWPPSVMLSRFRLLWPSRFREFSKRHHASSSSSMAVAFDSRPSTKTNRPLCRFVCHAVTEWVSPSSSSADESMADVILSLKLSLSIWVHQWWFRVSTSFFHRRKINHHKDAGSSPSNFVLIKQNSWICLWFSQFWLLHFGLLFDISDLVVMADTMFSFGLG